MMRKGFLTCLTAVGLYCLLCTGAWAKSMELTSALVYYNQGDKKQALEWLEKADAKNSTEVQVYALLVELYAGYKRWDEMNRAFARIDGCTDKEKKLRKFREQADNVIKQQWVPLARGSIDLHLEADELIAAGDSAGASANFMQAREKIEQALLILPDNADFLLKLGNSWIEQYRKLYQSEAGHGILRGSIPPYMRLAELHPDSLDYGVTLVQVLVALKEYRQAVSTVDGLLERFPEDPDLLSGAAKARIQLSLKSEDEAERSQLMKEAVAFVDRAVQANPEDLALQYDLARLYQEMGDFPMAISQYEKVISGKGEHTEYKLDALKVMALIYLQELPEEQLDPVKAVGYMDQALEFDPGNPDLRNLLWIALMRSGDPAMQQRAKEMEDQ